MPRRYGLTGPEARQIRDWYSLGHSQTEMARLLGCARATMRAYCQELELPTGQWQQRTTAARLRCDYFRRLCAELGWPEVNVPAHARILQALSAGPLLTSALYASLGWTYRGNQHGSNRNTHAKKTLRSMHALGYLVRTRQPGQREYTWSIAAWLLARRQGE